MKTRLLLFAYLCLWTNYSYAQITEDSIAELQARKHISFLAADSLKGRVNFSEEQLIAAEYINQEFKKYGLKPLNNDSFYIPFNSPAPLKPQRPLEKTLYNMVGLIPGKTKPDEVIIFSAHYDHVDKGLKVEQTGIFNGANDNASGVAAVLMLAEYFSKRRDNQRTIMFCLFAGEELGMYGSWAFLKLVKHLQIKAMINIEMIGQHNRVGKNAFFVTGSKYSDLEEIFKKNLTEADVKVKKEGKGGTDLFSRSDNYPFAIAGIVAHSIMSSDDNEPCYHKPCDNPDRIDYSNLTGLVRAIAKGSETIISGADTPKRDMKQKIEISIE